MDYYASVLYDVSDKLYFFSRRAGGDWGEMRGRAGLEKREGREKKGISDSYTASPLTNEFAVSSLKPLQLHTSVASIRMVFRAKSDSG